MSEQVFPRFSNQPAQGQIWFAKKQISMPGRKGWSNVRHHPERPELVLILQANQTMSVVQVVPVSYDRVFAGPYDLAFTRDTSPIAGDDIMIECWNLQPMLRTNLDVPRGKIGPAVLADVQYLTSCFIDDREPESVRLRSRGYLGSVIEGEDDPRVEFQRGQVELTAYLRAPANALE